MSKIVIDILNQGRERELHAVMQYMAEHYELENDGYDKLGDRIKEIAIVEMKHAESFAERILFLGGVPASKPSADVKNGMSIIDMIEYNEELETGAVALYNEAVKVCASEGDNVSKTLLESILAVEEEHVDEFQKISYHIEKLGDVYITTLID